MSLTLSRLLLNPLARAVMRDLSDVTELHRTVMSAFPDSAGEARRVHGVLHRLDIDHRRGRVELLVQSQTVPDWARLPEDYLLLGDEPNPCSKAVSALTELSDGRALTFRLRGNPTRRVASDNRSYRVELRGDDARADWLERKAEQGGFAIDSVAIREEPKVRGRRGRGRDAHVVTLQPVLFDGRLVVNNHERFAAALANGIGPGKAYGCGLLSVAP